MSVQGKGFPLDLGGSFTEDAPRPPVPGEEGEFVTVDPKPFSNSYYSGKSDGIKNETSTATPRRPDLDLGYEPEGSASPTPPYLKWAESLHSLLDDQDGINLLRTFLKQENCADLLDFWFACSGFRKREGNDFNEDKRLKLAKAIYKKYILDNNGIVSRQIKPATKSFIKDCVLKQQIDPAMFDQAQMEIQSMMEDNTYPVFLKSDIYLEYTTIGGESPKVYSDHSSGSGTGKAAPGYLPTVNEDEEWKCDQGDDDDGESAPSNRLTKQLILETASHRAAPTRKLSDGREFRPSTWREPVNPYYVNTGYALAPATSANDSEQQSMSSDADTMSLTDSSVYLMHFFLWYTFSYSSSTSKKQTAHDVSRPLSIERPGAVHPWVTAQLRNVVQPSHPFIQDPTMPPNPAPNPLTQLEEARRRLEEEEKRAGKVPQKQRYVQEVIQRGRASVRPAYIPLLNVVPAVSDMDLSESELKLQKKTGSATPQPCDNIVVAYYFCGEPIPYRTMVKGRVVTLGQFKELLTKKGNYRYYFKKVSDEFDCGVVFEEVREDDTVLPIYEEKIIGKVEKID
ncbi:axin-1 [Bombina bombina]|uniref:axin-1 n=1 Tax=Bombina bombina TaxID=8345 RepID=UPI00235B02CC|nr:axin-1 [Bombina bombina]